MLSLGGPRREKGLVATGAGACEADPAEVLIFSRIELISAPVVLLKRPVLGDAEVADELDCEAVMRWT